MVQNLSRREALKQLSMVAGVLSVVIGDAKAAGTELPHLAANNPIAVALSYHEDAKTVRVADFPTYKPEQKCVTCAQAKGKDGDAWRPCALFPANTVNANGWCKVWVKKA